MVQQRTCDYTGEDIEPGTGKMFVKKDGTILWFKDSKAQKNYMMGRESRDLEWIGYEEAAEEAETEADAEAEADEEAESEAADEEADEADDSDADEDAEEDEAADSDEEDAEEEEAEA